MSEAGFEPATAGCAVLAVAPLFSCGALGGQRPHSHFLVKAQALVDGPGVCNAFHDLLWELFEEVGRQVAAAVGDGVAGHDAGVVHHHSGCDVDFLTND